MLSACIYNAVLQGNMRLTKRCAYIGIWPCPLLTSCLEQDMASLIPKLHLSCYVTEQSGNNCTILGQWMGIPKIREWPIRLRVHVICHMTVTIKNWCTLMLTWHFERGSLFYHLSRKILSPDLYLGVLYLFSCLMQLELLHAPSTSAWLIVRPFPREQEYGLRTRLDMASNHTHDCIVLLKVLGECDTWSPCVQERLDSTNRMHLIQVG